MADLTLKHCLVRLFEAHPLRAKKRRDFEIWRIAVLDWATAEKSRAHDWSVVAECKAKLVEVRRYR